MNESARSSEPPDEPYLRSDFAVLSPASPKPLQFPQPTNIPVLENMMDVGFNQTEAHMTDPASRDIELRPNAWRDPNDEQASSNPPADQTSPSSSTTAEAAPNQGDAQQTGIQGESDVAHSHSTETAANRLDAHATQLSNGFSHIANSQLLANPVPSQVASTDDNVSISDPSVPAADAQSDAAPLVADPISAHSTGISLNPSQSSDGPVDVQAFLDALQTSIAPSIEANVAPSAESITVATTASPAEAQPPIPGAEPSSALSASGLGAPPTGLPPRPPPQDQPLINPNYVHSQHIRDYHPHAAHPAVQTHGRSNSSTNVEPNSAGYATQPSPSAVYRSHNPTGAPPQSNTPIESRREYKLAAGQTPTTEDQPWTADIQKKYDHFMDEERKYVNEARWDQFPVGSRLFVGTRDLKGNRLTRDQLLTEDSGNLSSEKVTKRDIFHVFHNYGELAQISIKQAYGFVQFLKTDDCSRALAAEQGRQIRDKRIHLEISKPQKSNKNQQQQQQNNRRSRSPDYNNRGRNSNNVDRYVSGGRGGNGRGRDSGGYRSGHRSPSPRGYRDRYDDRHRTRSRSPQYNRGYRSPRRDAADDLPLPRRPPREVPDVQVISLEQLDRDFLTWVEKSFADRGVRVDVLILSPRLSEEAVVKRQIVEGVLAVSKVKRANQHSSRIGLTIFKRTNGSRDVNFEEYDNLEPHIAAELVLREKAAQGGPPPSAGGYGGYQAQQPYSAPPPQYGYQPPPPQNFAPPPAGYPPAYAQMPQPPYGMPPRPPPSQPPNVDPNNLQNLLSTLNQAPPTAPPQTAGYPPNPAYPPPQSMYPGAQQQAPYAAQPPPQQSQAPAPSHNMQDILARLGSYGRS